jgi:hypothetical protein
MSFVYENTPQIKKQIKHYILRRLPNKARDTQLHRKILFNCMVSGGYLYDSKQVEYTYVDYQDQDQTLTLTRRAY